MIAVIFEVEPKSSGKETYFDIAGQLKEDLNKIEGFISVERFQSLVIPNKFLSLSFWQDEAAVKRWRTLATHRVAQDKGRKELFTQYRLRVAHVVRDYGLEERAQVPLD